MSIPKDVFKQSLNGSFQFTMSIPKDGFIYIIQQKDTSYYKVGFTQDDNIEKRMSNLNVGNPQELIFVGCFYTYNTELEKEIHIYLKENHTYIRGEWFELDRVAVENILDTKWREERDWYCDNLELTINNLFQEYIDVQDRMNTLLKTLRHVISRYRLSTHSSFRENSEKSDILP